MVHAMSTTNTTTRGTTTRGTTTRGRVTELQARRMRSASPTVDSAGATDWVHCGFRAYGPHARMIHDAAAALNMSAAAYMRKAALDHAAATLEAPPPDLTVYDGPSTDLVARAAERAGLTVRQYLDRAARQLAIKELGSLQGGGGGEGKPPPPKAKVPKAKTRKPRGK
jgi:hypothetical protein